MNFRDQLLAELSKRNTDYIASVIDRNEKLFKQIFDLIITNEEYVFQPREGLVKAIDLNTGEYIYTTGDEIFNVDSDPTEISQLIALNDINIHYKPPRALRYNVKINNKNTRVL